MPVQAENHQHIIARHEGEALAPFEQTTHHVTRVPLAIHVLPDKLWTILFTQTINNILVLITSPVKNKINNKKTGINNYYLKINNYNLKSEGKQDFLIIYSSH